MRKTALTTFMITCATTFSFATGETAAKKKTTLVDIVTPIADLLEEMLAPILLIVGAVGTLYCVLLGVKYARAEEPQDREKAKSHLKGAIIGFVLIFVLIVLLRFLLPYLTDWAQTVQVGK